MSHTARNYAILAWTALVVGVLGLNLFWPLPDQDEHWPWVGGLMAFPVAAALVLIHRPGNRVGWALGLVSVSAGLIFLMTWYAVQFPDAALSRHVEAVESIPAVTQFVGIIALLYLYPTGSCTTIWFRRAFATFLVMMSCMAVLFMLSSSPLQVTGRPNPLGVLPDWLSSIGDNGGMLLVPFSVIGVWSLAVRWRRAGTMERSQLKWFLAGSFFILLIVASVAVLPDDLGRVGETVGGVLVAVAFWSLPAAIVIAILRYNLYDIDRIINRTLVYALLTASLGATYFALIIGLQALLRPLSGGSDLAVVATTLVVAALFLPARRRVQNMVDRRFNRRSYDATQTVEAFSARLRKEIDLDTLRYELLAVVDETMQPARVSLWVREAEARR